MTSEDSTSTSMENSVPTLDALFEMDPEKMTDQDYNRVVLEFRKKREEWKAEDSAAKTQGRRAKTSKGVSVAETLGLDDLDIDITSLQPKEEKK